MNKTMFGVLTFAAGAVIGSAVTWKLTKTHYDKRNKEDADSVREYYNKKYGPQIDEELEELDSKTEENEEEDEYDPKRPLDIYEVKEYLDAIRENGYDAGVNNDSVREGGVMMADGPYVIPPIKFGENDDYEIITLFYHTDGILADDYGNPIMDVIGMVGVNPEDHFGEYERDCVYVRNDRMKADIEILRDEQKSTEVKKLDYHLTDAEDEV